MSISAYKIIETSFYSVISFWYVDLPNEMIQVLGSGFTNFTVSPFCNLFRMRENFAPQNITLTNAIFASVEVFY